MTSEKFDPLKGIWNKDGYYDIYYNPHKIIKRGTKIYTPGTYPRLDPNKKPNIDNNEVFIGINVNLFDFRAFAADLSVDGKYNLWVEQIPLVGGIGSITSHLYKILKSEIPKCKIVANSSEEYTKNAIVHLSERELSELLR